MPDAIRAQRPRRQLSQDQQDRRDKLDRRAKLETRGRPAIGAGWVITEIRDRQASPATEARRETKVTGAEPGIQVKQGALAIRAKRDERATRVHRVRPRHARQENTAPQTTIQEERVVSGIKTGLNSSSAWR